MARDKYIPSQDEIKDLLVGLDKLGSKETYDRLKDKVSTDKAAQIDEMCMDMNEFFVSMARSFNPGSESTEKTRNNLYQLASIFRYLAHETHKAIQGERNARFIELASYNPSVVTYMRK